MKYVYVVKFQKDSTRRTAHNKYEIVDVFDNLSDATEKLDELVDEQKKSGIYLSNRYGIKVVYC